MTEIKISSTEQAAAAGQYTKEETYWLDRFSGELAEGRFPYDYRKGIENERSFETVKFKFVRDLFFRLMKVINKSDFRLHIILVSGLAVLLDKYTANKDIILCTPVLRQEIEANFINSVLPLRIPLDDNKTFKESLLQMRQIIIEATENQNYPIDTLMYHLNMPNYENETPLFETAILLENIHDKKYLKPVNPAMVFSFARSDDCIAGELEYDSSLYLKTTIERIIGHFRNLLEKVIFNLDVPLAAVDLLSQEEKEKLLYGLNQTGADFPQEKTIADLFEEQAAKTPANTAVVHEGEQVDYQELNEKANWLAWQLKAKGVCPNTIVGILFERSVEMVIGILGTIKAGGTYLPIDNYYPVGRIRYMIEDSGMELLISRDELAKGLHTREMIFPHKTSGFGKEKQNPGRTTDPEDLLYVIYTSGSTGKPKGVLIKHRSFVNMIYAHRRIFAEDHNDRMSQTAAAGFDAMAFELWPCLCIGASLYIANEDIQVDSFKMKEWLIKNKITISYQPTVMAELLLNEEWPGKGVELRTLRAAGDRLKRYPTKKYPFKLYNLYGPTENTVWTTWCEVEIKKETNTFPPIGKPIGNNRLYIVGPGLELQPIGVSGELCTAGEGLSIGYLNKQEATNEQFIVSPFKKDEKIYRTGDLARWLADGNMEFIGRKDQQVKIRGFRIELGEIESHLLKHEDIKEAVVLAREIGELAGAGNGSGDKHICAFYVSHKKFNTTELRGFLSDDLPDYMLPTFFEQIDSIPLTENGKIDRKALPEPGLKAVAEYVPPRNMIEKTLVDIWAKALDVEKNVIGIDTDFFSLGGHSLKATVVVTTIHKKLNVKVPLVEIFRIPTIRELSRHIKNAKKDTFISIVPVEEKEYYALSSAQERLHFVQQMDLENTGYNTPMVLEMEGNFDMERFEEAFRKLIKRHESLRTSFVMTFGEEVLQKIHEDFEFEIEHYREERTAPKSGSKLQSLEDRCATVIGSFIRPFDLSRPPLMRVGVLKIEEERHILMIDMHHIISDGMSCGILVRDFLSLYEGKELPILTLRYKDYSEWQNTEKERESIKNQEKYWLNEFAGEVPVLNMLTDYKRPVVQDFSGSSINFKIGKEETIALNRIAEKQEATMFMILLASYNILLSKISNQEVIVIGTPVTGRKHADLEWIIGMFVNMLALQNHLTGEKTFVGFLDEVKEKSLSAFENQAYPFEDLVDRIAVNRDIGRNPVFDVIFAFQNMDILEVEIADLTLKPYAYKNKISKFDLSLHGYEIEDELLFTFEYSTILFKEATIERFIQYFKQVISSMIKNPEKKISGLEMISEKEKRQLLFDFNDTKAAYPADKTIQHLFEEQVERAPANTAVVFAGEELNYRELNEKSNSLANLLRAKGMKPDCIAGILVERSLDLIVSILGILKAGGVYLPIDPWYPGARVNYMLRDSNADLLLTRPEAKDKIAFPGIIIDPGDREIYRESGANLANVNVSADLAYIIYTSGTTGKPKGVMIEHRNVVRLMFNDRFLFRFDSSDTWTMFHSPCFDFSVWEMYGALLYGGKLIVISAMEARDPAGYLNILREHEVTVLNQTPSAFYNLLDEEIANDNRRLKIKYVIFGGEALKPIKLKKWQEKYPETKLINMFGITETTVHVTYKEIGHDEIESNISNIGKPIPTLSTYIMERDLNLLPRGAAGELCVAGKGVGRGYLNQQELAEEKFVKNPYNKDEFIYRSGDLAKLSEKGDMEYLGRLDQQVKIRGFRIELEEIERLLLQHDKIKEAVVQLKEPQESSDYPGGNGDKYLWAYVVPAAELTLSISELREYLANKLPDYMVPSYFVLIDEIPLTPNGKVDRKMLEFYGTNLGPGTEYAAPGNEMEKVIADTWKSVLKLDKVGVNDNFFDIGGHSTSIIRVNNKLKKAFEIDIPVVTLFRYPTVRSLARYLIKREEAAGIISTEEIDESLKLREEAANILLGDENA